MHLQVATAAEPFGIIKRQLLPAISHASAQFARAMRASSNPTPKSPTCPSHKRECPFAMFEIDLRISQSLRHINIRQLGWRALWVFLTVVLFLLLSCCRSVPRRFLPHLNGSQPSSLPPPPPPRVAKASQAQTPTSKQLTLPALPLRFACQGAGCATQASCCCERKIAKKTGRTQLIFQTHANAKLQK